MLNRCKWQHVRINSRFLVKKKRKKRTSFPQLWPSPSPHPHPEGSCLVMLHQWACIKHVKWSSVAVVSPCRTTARSRRAFSWNTRPNSPPSPFHRHPVRVSPSLPQPLPWRRASLPSNTIHLAVSGNHPGQNRPVDHRKQRLFWFCAVSRGGPAVAVGENGAIG